MKDRRVEIISRKGAATRFSRFDRNITQRLTFGSDGTLFWYEKRQFGKSYSYSVIFNEIKPVNGGLRNVSLVERRGEGVGASTA